MQLKKIIIISSLLLSTIFTNAMAKDGKIKVAFISGPELSIGQVAQKVAKEKYNLDVEIIEFTDYVTPNMALVDKSIDANAFQHLPYLEAQIKSRGWPNLTVVGNTFTWPIIAYSKKHTAKEQIPNKAKIGIPNDPANQGRALLLLQQEGFISLKDPKSLTQTVLDITDNPKELEIITLDGALIVPALPELDFAIINNTFAGKAKLDPNTALFKEGADSPYVNLIVAREDNKDDQDIINFVKAFQTEEVFQKALAEFDGFVIKGW